MKRFGSIYKIIRKSDGKSYIGQTTRANYLDRAKDHAYRPSSKMYIDLAMRKEGIAGFDIEELYVADSQKALDNAERLLIKEHKTLWPAGFNLSEGGFSGRKHSAHTTAKIRLARKGVPLLKRRGQPVSDMRRKQISTTLGGQIIVAVNLNNRQATYFMSAHEAGRFGFHPSNVVQCCKKRRQTHKDHKFYYLSNYENQSGSKPLTRFTRATHRK